MTNFLTNISKEEIAELPLRHFEGKIVLIENQNQLSNVISELQNCKYLGFDTETRPSFKKGMKNPYKVALLQLSTKNKAFLFRLHSLGLPKEIVSIFENKNITKIGLAISDDIKFLKRYSSFNAKAFVDLAPYSSEKFDIESNSLKKLTAIVLEFRISKSQQLSNWENNNLTEAQLLYAATDAWVCYEIFAKLLKK